MNNELTAVSLFTGAGGMDPTYIPGLELFHYSFTDIQRMVEKRRLWIIRFIFYSMMNQIRR